MYFLFASLNLSQMQEIPPLNLFSVNERLPMTEIISSFMPVIFNIASMINPGELK